MAAGTGCALTTLGRPGRERRCGGRRRSLLPCVRTQRLEWSAMSPTPFIAGGCVLLFIAAVFGVMTWRRTFARRSFMLGLLALVVLTAYVENQILSLFLAGVLILGIGCVAVTQLKIKQLRHGLPAPSGPSPPRPTRT